MFSTSAARLAAVPSGLCRVPRGWAPMPATRGGQSGRTPVVGRVARQMSMPARISHPAWSPAHWPHPPSAAGAAAPAPARRSKRRSPAPHSIWSLIAVRVPCARPWFGLFRISTTFTSPRDSIAPCMAMGDGGLPASANAACAVARAGARWRHTMVDGPSHTAYRQQGRPRYQVSYAYHAHAAL